jgi:hypothetical protein
MRRCVQAMAEAMDRRLTEHDYKDHLPRPTPDECLVNLMANLSEAIKLARAVPGSVNPAAADVANWLMLMCGVDVREPY